MKRRKTVGDAFKPKPPVPMSREAQADSFAGEDGMITHDEWVDRIFRASVGYSMTRLVSRGNIQTLEYKTFLEVLFVAINSERPMIYAHTKSGRREMLVPKQWQHFLDIYNELAGTHYVMPKPIKPAPRAKRERESIK